MAVPAPNAAQSLPDLRIVCRVCEKQFSKYTCPQCNLRYCSLTCYKKHSLRCTETFMRNNVMGEMRDIQATKESQQSMLETLKRIHFDEEGRSIFEDESLGDRDAEGEDIGDDDGAILSEKTIKIVAEGGDISLKDLSVEERSAFLRSIAAGEISHLIKPWDPWWLNPVARSVSLTRHGTSLVHDVHPSEAETTASESIPSSVPAPPSEPLAQVRLLVRREPSPLVSVLLVELVYGYCFTLRFYNGDWQSEPLEAASILITVSKALGQPNPPETVGASFAEAVNTVCSPAFKHAGGLEFAVALFDDSAAVLGLGKACVICALADVHRMLESAKKDLKAELGAKKQDHIKPAVKGIFHSSNGNGNSSSRIETTLHMDGGGTQSSSPQGSERNDENSFAGLKKARDSRRDSDTEKRLPQVEEVKTRAKLNGDSNSAEPNHIGRPPKQKKFNNMEERRLTAAIRKVYFLMCWTNEQPVEVFSSLALSVDAEKKKLLEGGVSNSGSGLQVMQEVKVPRTNNGGPIIEEIVEKRTIG